MKVFFSQPEFDGQLLRALTYSPVGGADLGECLTTAARIKEGDFDSWHQEWKTTGDRNDLEGEESLKNGHEVSARDCFLRASNYYRTAYFFLAGSPVDQRVIEAYDKHVETFEKAMAFSPYDVEYVAIPYLETSLPGYFFKCKKSEKSCPTIIAFPGYDGTRQEAYFLTAKAALERGYNVLCFDGPGQGELLIKRKIYMTPLWDEVITSVVDYLQKRNDVDQQVLMGISWGGMLAPLAAAKEHRLAALIASPGQYDALMSLKKALPQVEELLQEDNYTVLDQILSQIIADKMVAAKFKFKMWVHGADTAFELLKAWSMYSLVKTADQIKCPTLVVDCENEPFSQGQAKQLFDALKCPKEYMLFRNSEGAGEHCGAGSLTFINQRIFDWLADTLKSASCIESR